MCGKSVCVCVKSVCVCVKSVWWKHRSPFEECCCVLRLAAAWSDRRHVCCGGPTDWAYIPWSAALPVPCNTPCSDALNPFDTGEGEGAACVWHPPTRSIDVEMSRGEGVEAYSCCFVIERSSVESDQ